MLKKLYDRGYFDYIAFINDNMKLLSLNSDEVVLLIKILRDFPNHNTISIEYLMESLSMTKAKIEKALSSLLDRNFLELYISYDNGVGEEKINIDGFFDKANAIINHGTADFDNELKKSIEYLTKKLNRTMTASELDIIRSLVIDDKYTEENIAQACDKITSLKRNITMKSLAQTLALPETIEESKESPKIIRDFFASIK